MKKINLFIVLFLLSGILAAVAQPVDSGRDIRRFGLTYSSFGSSDVYRFEELTGAASYRGDKFFTLGIAYIKPMRNWLDLESGIEFSRHHIKIHPNLPPDMDDTPRPASFSLINVPIVLRVNFLKHFFLMGGALVDIHASLESPIDTQNGLGGILGLGLKYDFGFGGSVFINPYAKFHSLLHFSGHNYPQRVYESGLRIGLTYTLNSLKK
jgi:hypothetical protein